MKIVTELNKDSLKMLLVNKRYGTNCTSEELNYLLGLHTNTPIDGDDIKNLAINIKAFSDTKDNVSQIAQEILDYCFNYLAI